MDRIQKFLSSKVGPIPVSVILAVLAAAALYAVIRFVPRQSTSEDEIDEETEGDPVVSDLTGTTTAVGPFVAQRPFGATSSPAFAEPTNETWVRQGVQWATGQGTRADYAQNALERYLRGEDLSFQQDQLVQQVVTKFGVPPTLPDQIGKVGTEPSATPSDPGPVQQLRLERRMTRTVHLIRWSTTPSRGSFDQVEIMIYRRKGRESWRKIWGPKLRGKVTEQKVQVTPGWEYDFRIRYWNSSKKSTPSGPWTSFRWRA